MVTDNQIKWDKRFLDLAWEISKWSKDPSTKVGAVITRNKHIVSIGYNGFPEAIEDKPELLNNRDFKYRAIIHGEINALLSAANKDVSGCTLYTVPFMPCSICASIFMQTGIKRVVSVKNTNPRWEESFKFTQDLFKPTENFAGIELTIY